MDFFGEPLATSILAWINTFGQALVYWYLAWFPAWVVYVFVGLLGAAKLRQRFSNWREWTSVKYLFTKYPLVPVFIAYFWGPQVDATGDLSREVFYRPLGLTPPRFVDHIVGWFTVAVSFGPVEWQWIDHLIVFVCTQPHLSYLHSRVGVPGLLPRDDSLANWSARAHVVACLAPFVRQVGATFRQCPDFPDAKLTFLEVRRGHLLGDQFRLVKTLYVWPALPEGAATAQGYGNMEHLNERSHRGEPDSWEELEAYWNLLAPVKGIDVFLYRQYRERMDGIRFTAGRVARRNAIDGDFFGNHTGLVRLISSATTSTIRFFLSATYSVDDSDHEYPVMVGFAIGAFSRTFPWAATLWDSVKRCVKLGPKQYSRIGYAGIDRAFQAYLRVDTPERAFIAGSQAEMSLLYALTILVEYVGFSIVRRHIRHRHGLFFEHVWSSVDKLNDRDVDLWLTVAAVKNGAVQELPALPGQPCFHCRNRTAQVAACERNVCLGCWNGVLTRLSLLTTLSLADEGDMDASHQIPLGESDAVSSEDLSASEFRSLVEGESKKKTDLHGAKRDTLARARQEANARDSRTFRMDRARTEKAAGAVAGIEEDGDADFREDRERTEEKKDDRKVVPAVVEALVQAAVLTVVAGPQRESVDVRKSDILHQKRGSWHETDTDVWVYKVYEGEASVDVATARITKGSQFSITLNERAFDKIDEARMNMEDWMSHSNELDGHPLFINNRDGSYTLSFRSRLMANEFFRYFINLSIDAEKPEPILNLLRRLGIEVGSSSSGDAYEAHVFLDPATRLPAHGKIFEMLPDGKLVEYSGGVPNPEAVWLWVTRINIFEDGELRNWKTPIVPHKSGKGKFFWTIPQLSVTALQRVVGESQRPVEPQVPTVAAAASQLPKSAGAADVKPRGEAAISGSRKVDTKSWKLNSCSYDVATSGSRGSAFGVVIDGKHCMVTFRHCVVDPTTDKIVHAEAWNGSAEEHVPLLPEKWYQVFPKGWRTSLTTPSGRSVDVWDNIVYQVVDSKVPGYGLSRFIKTWNGCDAGHHKVQLVAEKTAHGELLHGDFGHPHLIGHTVSTEPSDSAKLLDGTDELAGFCAMNVGSITAGRNMACLISRELLESAFRANSAKPPKGESLNSSGGTAGKPSSPETSKKTSAGPRSDKSIKKTSAQGPTGSAKPSTNVVELEKELSSLKERLDRLGSPAIGGGAPPSGTA